MTDAHLADNRIVQFVMGWRQLSSARRSPPVERVRRLFDGARPLLRQTQPSSPKRRETLSSEAAGQLFEGMRAPLAQARSTGAFLNIWSVTGISRKELPNAAVLAWLIDPRGSHGHGVLCLSALLTMVGEKSGLDTSDITLDGARVQAEERPLGSDRDRVDIVVETPNLLIFLEVKIDAMEGQAQLSRYIESAAQVAAVRAISDARPAKRSLTVFLSPRAPAERSLEVVHVTWRDLAAALHAAARHGEGLSRLLIDSFAIHIRAFG